jgi:hypothetical protein
MPSAAVREQAAARRLRVVDLRAAGLSWQAIAAEVGGVTPQRAHAIYRAGLAQLANGTRRGPVARPGRDGPAGRRVLLAALGGELAALGTSELTPARELTAVARRVGRRLPPGDGAAFDAALDALTGAAVLTLRLSPARARRLATAGLVEAAGHGVTWRG